MTAYQAVPLPGVEEARPTKVHPFADQFPMMSEEDLADLAADIKANGQIHPIMLDGEGQLIDGRNRERACEMAGVVPLYATLPPDTDPVVFILSANVKRRHLNKGQKGMAVAKGWLVSNQTQRVLGNAAGLNHAHVAKAAVILQHTPEQADAVLAGALGLEEAYADARRIKDATEDSAKAGRKAAAELAALREQASDLADLVVEGRMQLGEARAAAVERERRERQQRQVTTGLLAEALRFLDAGPMTQEERGADVASRIDQEFVPAGEVISVTRIRQCVATLEAIAAALEEA